MKLALILTTIALLAELLLGAWVVTRQQVELANRNRQIQVLEQEAKSKGEEIARLSAEAKRLSEQVAELKRQLNSAQAAKSQPAGAPQEQANMAIHDWFMFFPSKYPDGDWTPRDLKFEDCWLTAGDGVKIHAWYCPHERPRAALLISQGNAGNLSYWDDLLRYAHDKLAVSSLIYDYRGYGRSEGKPTIPGVLLDVRAARDELAKREQIKPQNVVLFGRSLGGAVSIDLAAEKGARGLIVESTFTSLRDVAGGHYPPALVNLVVPDVLNSLAKINQYRGPLLLSHGTADQVIPFAQGERLFAAANEPKKFITIQRGDHNDPQSDDWFRAFEEFIRSLPPQE